jgi:hypothetical protein
VKGSISPERVPIISTKEDGTLHSGDSVAFKKCKRLWFGAIDGGKGMDARMKQRKGCCAAAHYDDTPRSTKPRVFKGCRVHGSKCIVVAFAGAGAATSRRLNRNPEHVPHNASTPGCSRYLHTQSRSFVQDEDGRYLAQ